MRLDSNKDGSTNSSINKSDLLVNQLKNQLNPKMSKYKILNVQKNSAFQTSTVSQIQILALNSNE